jgi:hypothetical protein
MAVDDRWHKAYPKAGEPRCREHDLVPTAIHGKGKRWEARWRNTLGDQKKRFEKKSDAARHESGVRADLLRGTYVDPSAGKVTL